MKLSIVTLVAAGTLCLTGCSSLVSLDAIFTEKEAAIDKGLLGVWENGKHEATYIVRPDGKGYGITYLDKNGSGQIKLKALLVRAGDVELLDVVSESDDPFQLQVHHPMRVWPGGTTLKMAFLDSDWMREQAAREVPAHAGKDRVTLVGAPHDFVVHYGADDRAFKDVETLYRVQ